MNKLSLMAMAFSAIGLVSCQNANDTVKGDLENSDGHLIFPRGAKIENDRFSGTAWLQTLVEGDGINHIAVGSVTFEPGARTHWHLHPDGQIILALEGKGYYQEKGSPKKILRKGDVVTCPPDVPHWHGASADQAFVQVAVTSRLKGPTTWLNAVSEEEYHADE